MENEEKVLLKISKIDDLGAREEVHYENQKEFISICIGIMQFMKEEPISILVIKDLLEKAASGNDSFEVMSNNEELPDFNEILRNAKVNPNNNIKEN